jgi:hypothetical protein
MTTYLRNVCIAGSRSARRQVVRRSPRHHTGRAGASLERDFAAPAPTTAGSRHHLRRSWFGLGYPAFGTDLVSAGS